ncbi:MAG: hypothetical protein Q8L81_17375 [Bacteroidota bacterium]|nr:hypothetical protein [Bacteroidota bacterium]
MKVLVLISAIIFISLQGLAQKGCNAVFVKPVHVKQEAPAKQLQPVQKKFENRKAGLKIIAKAKNTKQNGNSGFVPELGYAVNSEGLTAERISQYKTILKNIN